MSAPDRPGAPLERIEAGGRPGVPLERIELAERASAPFAVHAFGDPDGEALLCLHGLGGHGARFRRLAELLPGRRLVAPDLRGHGRSSWAPPWTTETHVRDVLALAGALGLERADWLGYSYGGRILAALAAAAPERVARACLLEPALSLPAPVCRERAEAELEEVAFASAEGAVEHELASGLLFATPRELLEEEAAVHLERRADGLLVPRYSRAMAIAAWSEMARRPPPAAAVATLVVRGERSWVPVDEARLRAALGDRLRTETVPGGHSVLWDALHPTARAVAAFLS